MKKLIIVSVVIACVFLCAKRALIPSDAQAENPGVVESVGNTLHYPNLDMVDMPSDIPSYPKSYTGFRLSFNPHRHTPNWVGWELLASETDGPISRSNQFWQDESVKGCPAVYDYKNSGYDRGHLCPSADQKWSQNAMSDCFVLTNICPQDASLNRGAWQTLEKKERLWAQRDSAIVIIAGPLYQPSDSKTIGDSKILVPSAFFKAFCAPYINKPRAIAFVYPNMSAPGNMENYVMTIDQLESLTGFDFFASLPDDIENEIEAVASFKEWNQR